MSEWFESLDGIFAQLWTGLEQGVADRNAPARHPTIATVSVDGWPETRMVVLRSATRETGGLEVHTDITSAKVASLRAQPRAELHVWDSEKRLQTRARCTVTMTSGVAAAEIWKNVPDPGRQSYGITPPPGHPIATALAYEKRPLLDSFAVLTCQIDRIDAVYLGAAHRRAVFVRKDCWAGQWCAP